MAFTYQIEITAEHFVELQALLWSMMKSQPEIQKWHGRVNLLLVVSIAALLIFAVDFLRNDPPARQFTFLVVAVIFLVGWSMALRWHYTFSMKQWAAQSHTILGKETLTVSDDGIATIGVLHRAECSWDAVVGILETENLVVFLTDPTKGYICPKASIPEAEYDTLLSYGREQIAS